MTSVPSTVRLVPTGLAARPEVAWGTHICHFYRSVDDLVSVLVPYFAAGLGHLERCVWIASEPLPAAAAARALRRAVPDLERHLEEGAIEILDHDEWYLRESSLEQGQVLSLWLARERQALREGFNGLRISGNTSWLGADDRQTFQSYERSVHDAFRSRRILALCSYSLDRCGAQDILDVARTHGFALIRRKGTWEAAETVTQLVAAAGEPIGESGELDQSNESSGWSHGVQLMPAADRFPAVRVAEFLLEGLGTGGGAAAVTSPEHWAEILRACEALDIDTAARVADGSLVWLDADETLAALLRNGKFEPSLFTSTLAPRVEALCAGDRRLWIYGEMVDLLWRRSDRAGALALEDLWSELLARLPVRALCGYAIEGFDDDEDGAGFGAICSRHDRVEPVEDLGQPPAADPARLVAELQVRASHARESARRRQEAEDAERRARRQLEAANQRLAQLQRVTAALSEAVTPDDIGRVVIDEIAPAVRAPRAVLILPDGSDALRVVVRHGFPRENQELFSRVGVDAPLPAADAFRTGRAIFLSSAAELAELYPDLAGSVAAPASASMPLEAGGRTLGVLGFGFDGDHYFSPMECALLHDFARQVASALDRSRLYEAARSSEARLLEASRRKDEFLALLGHELRNPLAPIVTALEVMKLKLESEASRFTELGVIERQVNHLRRLVDDLLDVSRITEGKLELRRSEVDLDAVLKLAVELASPLIKQRGHRLVVSSGERLRVEADASRLAQAVGNVLGNAAKYTAPGGTIALRSRREGADAVVEVADTGSGIDPEMLSSIFEPFMQVERTVESAQGGLGLGLALVKSVVELHGGSVRASSEGLGRGSEFRIRIPALPPPSDAIDATALAATDAAGDPANGSNDREVLIVDDNRDAADSLAAMLRLLGHRTHVAYDGRGALAKARAASIDVALLDIDLPDMSGYDVARKLREQSARPGLFIAVTGFGTDEDRRRSLSEGFLDHLVKPIDHEHLLHLLRS